MNTPTAIKQYQIAEVEFYAPSLSYMAPIVDSTEHYDVYPVEKIVDGNPEGTSYYESATLPAIIVIDLKDLHSVNVIVLSLPPSLKWEARTQVIGLYYSDSTNQYYKETTEFKTLVAEAPYLFDPVLGNRVLITLDEPVNMKYLKLVIISNDTKGGYNAQLSEVSVYGE